jgi:hypothetical protein
MGRFIDDLKKLSRFYPMSAYPPLTPHVHTRRQSTEGSPVGATSFGRGLPLPHKRELAYASEPFARSKSMALSIPCKLRRTSNVGPRKPPMIHLLRQGPCCSSPCCGRIPLGVQLSHLGALKPNSRARGDQAGGRVSVQVRDREAEGAAPPVLKEESRAAAIEARVPQAVAAAVRVVLAFQDLGNQDS